MQLNGDTTLRRKVVEITVILAALTIVFFIVNAVHFRTLPVSVILYSCIIDIAVAAAVVFSAYWFFWRKRSALLGTELAMAAAIGALGLSWYAVIGPTVIDRSLSLYIVEKLDLRGGRIAYDAFDDMLVDEFMTEFRVPDVRLTEQIASGTAVLDDGCIVITNRGRAIASFLRFYRGTFLPKKRVLLGEITDELAQPVHGPELVDIRCEGDD